MTQQFNHPVLSLRWCRFDPLPWNFWVQPEKEKKKKKDKVKFDHSSLSLNWKVLPEEALKQWYVNHSWGLN